MVEIGSNVFDVVYPSPIPLRDLSSIAVAVQLWHLDLNQYLENGDFSEDFYDYCTRTPRITLRDIIPHIPLVVHHMTGKYLKVLVSWTKNWLVYHFDRIFMFHRDNYNVILQDFSDIVCNYNGAIDYVRTAKRMMLCDRISPDEKFKIACLYSFEEYIKQIGPSVQSNVDLDVVDFDRSPHQYYWVCYLRNKMDEIPNKTNMPIDQLMLKKTEPVNRSSFEYFWNRTSPESRFSEAVSLCRSGKYSISFCDFWGRFFLPRLNEQQLTAFVAQQGDVLLYRLWNFPETREHVFPIWMYIKDKIVEANFTRLVENMLQSESRLYIVNDNSVEEWNHYNEEIENLLTCCEIWTSAPVSLKKLTLKKILHRESLFKDISLVFDRPRERRFLPMILLDATLQERNIFWRKYWPYLVVSTSVSVLIRIMNSCFSNKTEIDQFKRTTMAKYENLIKIGDVFIRKGYFKELTDLLNYCCIDPYICTDLKRRFLRSKFLTDKYDLFLGFIEKFKSMQDFIDDAYAENPELAGDFRNQFISSAHAERYLLSCIRYYYLLYVKQFVESFELVGQNVDQLKKRLFYGFRKYLIKGRISEMNSEHLQVFVLWCLGSDDRVIEFKQSISPNEVLSNMPKFQQSSKDADQFLLWYFITPQKIDEFKRDSRMF